MIKPSKLALVKLWLELNPVLLGLLGAAVVLAAALGVWCIPIGSARQISGVVQGLGFGGGKVVPHPIAFVRLANRNVVVQLHEGQSCVVGSRISILRERYLWGIAFDAAWLPCVRLPKN